MNSLEYTSTFAGLDLAKTTVEDLYAKYADDPLIFAKMHNYICFRLPAVIEDIKRSSDERRIRNEFLSTEQDAFITAFLNDNRYFYCPQTELYFYYNGESYATKRDDDVLHHILTSITKQCNALIPRKPQTKVYIMKRIKECNPLKSIPESCTIQTVLDSLCPVIFQTKSAAKYFLTILGDHLLKKNDETSHVYFTSPKAKEFLREVAAISQCLFGISATAMFKHKYHSHAFRTVRLLPMNDAISVESVWRPVLQLLSIDLLCVAAHYSGRFETADQYLETYSDDTELVKYATHFRWKSVKDVAGEFAAEYLRVSDDPETRLTESTMEYLWKKYLKEHQFPAVLGPQGFLSAIIEHYPDKYDSESSCFRGLSSSHSGVIERFHRFWRECIVVDKTEPLAEYEIDELVMMYRQWSSSTDCRNTSDSKLNENIRITDSQMLDLIRFYLDVDVIDNKFVQGIKSDLWDKQSDLKVFFLELRQNSEEDGEDSISFYDAYSKYQRFCKRRGKKPAFLSQDTQVSNSPLSDACFHIEGLHNNCQFALKPKLFLNRVVSAIEDSSSKRRLPQMVNKHYFEKYIYDALDAGCVADGKIIFSYNH